MTLNVPSKEDDSSSKIRVAVRVRPFLPIEAGSKSCVDVLPGIEMETAGDATHGQSVRIGGGKGHTFTFDAALSGHSTQCQVYHTCVSPLITSCLMGYNATTLAYGQTGAGKTYTILGPSTSAALSGSSEEESSIGVIPRALRDLFAQLEEKHTEFHIAKEEAGNPGTPEQDQSSKASSFEFEVRIQFLELYGEEIRDLLAAGKQQKLAIRDSGHDAEVLGATEVSVSSAQDALLCLTRGMLRRVTGATAMNAESSRSHAIMTVILEQKTTKTARGSDGASDGPKAAVEKKRSKFNFVDLAGSERQKRTGAKGKRLKEGIDINKGLLVLGNVISALGDPKKGTKFVPFRDSKLTRLLKGSLGGNHKTLMIACVSPSAKNMEESLNCLRYANRAKNIKNKAVVQLDPASRLVAELRGQLDILATELLRVRNGGDINNDKISTKLIESLAKGGAPRGTKTTAVANNAHRDASSSNDAADKTARSELLAPESSHTENPQDEQMFPEELAAKLKKMEETLKRAQLELESTTEQLEKVTAERDLYQQQVHSLEASNKVYEMAKQANEKTTLEEETINSIVEKIASYDIRPLLRGSSIPDTETSEDETVYSDDYALSTQSFGADVVTNEDSPSAEFAAVLYNTGVFLVDHEEYEQSIPCFQVVLQIRRELFGWDHPLVGDALHMEGRVHIKTGDFDRALLVLWDTLKIRETASDFIKVAETLRLLADLHVIKEEYMHAAMFYEECWRHQKEHAGYNDESTPEVLMKLGGVKAKMGDHDEALAYFEQVIDIWSMRLDADDLRMAQVHFQKAMSAFGHGDDQKGVESLEEFVRIRQLKGDGNDPEVANALYNLGNVYGKRHEYETAHSCWLEALLIFERIGLADDDPCITTLQRKIMRCLEDMSGGHKRGLRGLFRRSTDGTEPKVRRSTDGTETKLRSGIPDHGDSVDTIIQNQFHQMRELNT